MTPDTRLSTLYELPDKHHNNPVRILQMRKLRFN